jgi:hypothetical protein
MEMSNAPGLARWRQRGDHHFVDPCVAAGQGKVHHLHTTRRIFIYLVSHTQHAAAGYMSTRASTHIHNAIVQDLSTALDASAVRYPPPGLCLERLPAIQQMDLVVKHESARYVAGELRLRA